MSNAPQHSLIPIFVLVLLVLLGVDLGIHVCMVYVEDGTHTAYKHIVGFMGHLTDLLEVAFGALIGALSATLHHSISDNEDRPPATT